MTHAARTFDAYRKEYFALVRKHEGPLDSAGPLRLPEALALRLMWGYESGAVVLPDDPAGRAARILFAKLTNELMAFVGSVRVGSMMGAFHHVRAIIETRAAVHYLWLAQPAKRGERVERYLMFLDAIGWLRLQEARNAGDLPRAQLLEDAAQRAGRVFSEVDINRWCAVFEVDVRKRPQDARWHPKASISKMIEACDPSGAARGEYWAYSHATHPSPMGGRFSGGEDLRLIGFDWNLLPGAVDGAMLHSHFAVVTFDSAWSTDLCALVRAEVHELVALRTGRTQRM